MKMSEDEPNENKESPYYMLLPELTLTAFDFDALNLREEDIALLLSPMLSQHPLDFSPDLNDFADLAEHVLSDPATTERRSSTGEWERELYGRQPLSEGPLTPEELSLPVDSPSQYPLDYSPINDASTRVRSVVVSPQPFATGSGHVRERSDGAQRPDSTGADADTYPVSRDDQFRSVPPGTAGSSSDTSLPVSSSSSQRSFQARRKAEGGRRRTANTSVASTNQRDVAAARLQRKRSSDTRHSRNVAGGEYARTTFATGRGTMSPREGPSDGFDSRADPTQFRTLSVSEVSSDERGSREGSVPASTDGAGFFFDQPRGEPMGSEGEMLATVPARGRNFVTGTDSETDDGSLRGAGRARSLSGEEGSGGSVTAPFRNNLRRTDWLRGTVEGADDDAEAGATAAPLGAAPLQTWWQQPPVSSSINGNYLESTEPVVDQEGNVRPPLVGQSEERRSVAGAAAAAVGQTSPIPEVADTESPRIDRESTASQSSEPGTSSRTGQAMSTSTLASKDSLAHRVVHLLQPGESPPDWLLDVDDDDDEEVGAMDRPQVRADYPRESIVRREYLSAFHRDSRVVSVGKGHGQDDSEEECVETETPALGPRFSGGDEMGGMTRFPEAAEFVSGGGDHADDQVSAKDLIQVDQTEHSDDHHFGLSSAELTDVEQLQVPSFVAATLTASRNVGENTVDHHAQRAVSPSVMSVSSVASSKRLEWDSGADIGYGGPRVMYGLSTLERMAIGSSTVFQRMDPEGKSALGKNANAAAAVPIAAAISVSDGEPRPIATSIARSTDDVHLSVAPADLVPVSRHSSRSTERLLQSPVTSVVQEVTFPLVEQAHSPESGETYPIRTTATRPNSGGAARHVSASIGPRSNSMMDLSRPSGPAAESSEPLHAEKKYVSTSDIKGSSGSSVRLYKLINSWFSSTTSGLSTTSSGGTVVPVATGLGSELAPLSPSDSQHDGRLCSTAIEGSGSRTVKHRPSFHTPVSERPSSNTFFENNSNDVKVSEAPIEARPIRRSNTYLAVPGIRVTNVVPRSPDRPPFVPEVVVPPPPRAEQEVRLLAFAEKFVSSLCPSANPARRMKMASRILEDIGALLKASERQPSDASSQTVRPYLNDDKTTTKSIRSNNSKIQASTSGSANNTSMARQPSLQDTFNVETAAEQERWSQLSMASAADSYKLELSGEPEIGSDVAAGTVVQRGTTTSINSNRKHSHLHELRAGAMGSNANSEKSIQHHESVGSSSKLSPRIVTSTTTTFSVSSSATTDYYVVDPRNRLPLDGRDRAIAAVSTDSEAFASTTTSRQTLHSIASASGCSAREPPWSEDVGSSSVYETRSRKQGRHGRRSTRSALAARSPGNGFRVSDSASSDMVAIYSTVSSDPATTSPQSLRLLRELVQRQRRRYMKTLQKEVAWLEKMEAILGRKKTRPRSLSSSRPATSSNELPKKDPSLRQRGDVHPRPLPSRPAPVKATRDFGQSYPTPCPPSYHQLTRKIYSRERSASVGSAGGERVSRCSDTLMVHSNDTERRVPDDRPIVTLPVADGDRASRASGSVVVRTRKRVSSLRRGAVTGWSRKVDQSPRFETGGKESEEKRSFPKKSVAYFLPISDDPLVGRASVRRSRADGQPGGADINAALSLQDVFRQKRADILAHMEQRQNQLKTTAFDRGATSLHHSQPAPITGTIVINLLDVQTRNRKYTVPLPVSGQHHRPVHREFTEKQMRWQTNRVIQDLPEVAKKIEEIRRETSRQSNRLMARRFNKKLQELALHGKVSLSHTQKCL